MSEYSRALAVLGICLVAVLGCARTSSAEQNPVTAIDLLLEPDGMMLQHAKANNARLLAVYPKGFALDATHRPHITMLQCFVRTVDFDKVCTTEEKVLAAADINAMKLEAFKFYYIPAGSLGVAGICARPTPQLLELQTDIIAAAKPFMLETGPIGAFTAGHENPAIDLAMIKYVSTFDPTASGANSIRTSARAPRRKITSTKKVAEPLTPIKSNATTRPSSRPSGVAASKLM